MKHLIHLVALGMLTIGPAVASPPGTLIYEGYLGYAADGEPVEVTGASAAAQKHNLVEFEPQVFQ